MDVFEAGVFGSGSDSTRSLEGDRPGIYPRVSGFGFGVQSLGVLGGIVIGDAILPLKEC